MIRIFLFAWLPLLWAGCSSSKSGKAPVNENSNTLLWEVSGNGIKKPSYLFGTFHLLCKEDIHFSQALKDAMQRCDTVYMEMDMDDPSTLMGGLLFMSMKDGKTLKDLYTTEEYKRLSEFFLDSLGTPLTMLQKMKPYFLVALFYPRLMSCKTPTGVEQELVKLSKEYKKEINGLETIQFQASVFDSIPYEWQAKELLKNVDSTQQMKQEFDQMVRLYKNQQLDSVGILINKSEFSDDKYGRILLTDRNKNWVNKLDKLVKNESVFVAVGAGHLPGKEGLIQLLREKGYEVTPVKNN